MKQNIQEFQKNNYKIVGKPIIKEDGNKFGIKNVIIVIFAVCFSFFSCSKDDTSDPKTFQYRVKEFRDKDNVLLETIEYNSQNKVTRQYSPNGGYVNFFYNNSGVLISKEDKAYNSNSIAIENYTYDVNGFLVETIMRFSTSNYARKKSYLNNGIGLPITKTNFYTSNYLSGNWIEDRTIQITYNSRNLPASSKLVKKIDPVTQVVSIEEFEEFFYDERGNKTKETLSKAKSNIDDSYYLYSVSTTTFDNVKPINYLNVDFSDNILTNNYKSFNLNGSILYQSSYTKSYEYNEAGYVTKVFEDGNLKNIIVLEKIN